MSAADNNNHKHEHDHEHNGNVHNHGEHAHHHGCCCSHDHNHEGEHVHGHEHSHEHNHEHSHSHEKEAGKTSGSSVPAGYRQEIYLVGNIDCANCAAEVEEALNKIPEIHEAVLTFFTKQLKITAKNPDALLDTIRKVADRTEPGVTIMPRPGADDVPAGCTVKIYSIENLDCANCAAEVEEALNKIPGIHKAVVTFATKQLKVIAENPDALLETMREAADKTEPGTLITARKDAKEFAKARPTGFFSKENMPLIEIISGAVLFVIGEFTSLVPEQYALYLYIIAYIILGGKIVKTAAVNLMRGKVFDENFLMSIATLGAFAISEYPEAVGVMLFYRIGEYFEHRATEKSRTQIMEAVDLRPETVNLINGGEIKVIPAQQTKIGDILLVRAGDRIPVDGVVVEGESRVDTSPVTGEPVPVKIETNSVVTSGCLNISGVIKMRVEKPLSESMVTRILSSVENAASTKPKIDRFITRFARIYTPIVVAVAAATAVVPSLITGDWERWIYTALTFLVISCPCALVLSVPLAFFSGIGAGSRKGILFKGGVSLEAIKNVKAIVMDKTGTLTKGSFTVKEILPASGYDSSELLRICASCEAYSTHPIAVSIVNAAKNKNLALAALAESNEIAGEGLICKLENELSAVCGNKRLMDRCKIDLPKDAKSHADTEIYIAVNNRYAGSVIIGDTIKDDAESTVQRLKNMGLTTAMLTGDNESSANAVAKAVGIDEVHAKLLPEGKLNELSNIRKKHGSVLFVGDGINDAPILAGADVGAAMGSGADAAIEAADVVFMNSKVASILQAINISRSTISIAWQNVAFALVVKIAIMLLGLAGFASMWAAVFADTGVSILCILNSVRILYKNY